MTGAYPYTYTCEGCGAGLDPYELDEFGHICDDWWDDHGIFDALPMIRVEANPDHTDGSDHAGN